MGLEAGVGEAGVATVVEVVVGAGGGGVEGGGGGVEGGGGGREGGGGWGWLWRRGGSR